MAGENRGDARSWRKRKKGARAGTSGLAGGLGIAWRACESREEGRRVEALDGSGLKYRAAVRGQKERGGELAAEGWLVGGASMRPVAQRRQAEQWPGWAREREGARWPAEEDGGVDR